MKKLLFLFLLLLSIITLGGCTSNSRLKNIEAEEIFMQEESSYFVFFYKDDCEDCENTKYIIEGYLQLIEDDDEYKNKSTIYGCNLTNEPNSQIFRKYEGKNGQGDDETFFVNDVNNWEDLYIASTASLISIRTRNGEKYAEFEAEGYEAISERLQDHLE